MKRSIVGGLVSVTFRKLSRERIVELVRQGGLSAIEWGGDVHVPHGDTTAAKAARTLCDDTGLIVSGYGSYYRAGASPPADFVGVLDCARALGTNAIRVWAGVKGSGNASDDERRAVIDDLQRICGIAHAASVRIDLEFHGGTLTDTTDSTLALLAEVGRPNLRTYWQPPHGESTQQNLADLERLRPWLANLHVFHWWPDNRTRLPLADGAERWRPIFNNVADEQSRFALLEFVRADDEQQFVEDARTLRSLLDELNAC